MNWGTAGDFLNILRLYPSSVGEYRCLCEEYVFDLSGNGRSLPPRWFSPFNDAVIFLYSCNQFRKDVVRRKGACYLCFPWGTVSLAFNTRADMKCTA